MDQLMTAVMVLFIGIIGIGIAMTLGSPVIGKSMASSGMSDAQNILSALDIAIMQVASEGNGSARVISFYSNTDGFATLPDEDAVEYSFLGNFADAGARSFSGNMMTIADDDCNCYTTNDSIIMENEKITVALQRVNGTVDASSIIMMSKNKITNVTVPAFSTRVMMSGADVSVGSGYTRLLTNGRSRPLCMATAYIVSGNVSYRMVYTLYTGSDYLAVDLAKNT